jgi:hypothetical protein
LADRPLNAAQALDLFEFQTQSGHFQILGTEMVEDIFNRCQDGNPSRCSKSRLRLSSPTTNPGQDDIPLSVSEDVANRCMSQNRTDLKSSAEEIGTT